MDEWARKQVEQLAEPGEMVSVIIPTYNRAHLLGRAIESALTQTYGRLEVIVVDDGSRDNTREVVATWQDRRLQYIRHERNKGGSAARNTGIRMAKGDYIAFLDSDDEWVPDKVARHLQEFGEHPQHAVVYSAVCHVFLDGTQEVTGADGPEGWIFDKLLVRNAVGPTSAFVIKRASLEQVGGFDETLPSGQDYDLWLRLAQDFTFKRISDPLVIYHWHGDQISTNIDAKARGHLALMEKYEDEIASLGPRVEAEWHFYAGSFLCRAGDVRAGRQHLVRSVWNHPSQLQYAIYLASWLPGTRIRQGILSLNRTMRRAWRSVKASVVGRTARRHHQD